MRYYCSTKENYFRGAFYILSKGNNMQNLMPRLKGELLIMINYSKDYFYDILIRMAYNSSGMEL